jgi:uncharacterized protein YkwD
MNKARTNPAEFAEVLREFRRYYNGNLIERPGEIAIRTNEGTEAVDEAIRFLQNVEPIEPLIPSRGLSLAARDHMRDTGPQGVTGHAGTDGSTMSQRIERYGKWQGTAGENISYGENTAKDIVVSLIIDDGVAGRGHRKNIFNSALKVAGVSFGKHSTYRVMCVIDFAGGFVEKGGREIERTEERKEEVKPKKKKEKSTLDEILPE